MRLASDHATIEIIENMEAAPTLRKIASAR
jgi:hypothetical protein